MAIEFGEFRVAVDNDHKYIALISRFLELLSLGNAPRHDYAICAWSLIEPRFVYVSDGYCNAVGMNADEAMKRTFLEALHPDYFYEGMEEWEKNSKTGESKFFNLRSDHIHKRGHRVQMWWDGVNDASIGLGIGIVYFYERD